jgi:hypothetical protein
MMQVIELSQEIAETSERDLARKLRQQIAEWKAMRSPARTRTASGIQVEHRFKRRLDARFSA